MSENYEKPKQEVLNSRDAEPFVVRGHHALKLAVFIDFMQEDISVGALRLACEYSGGKKINLKDENSMSELMVEATVRAVRRHLLYGVDVLGVLPRTTSRAKAGIQAFFDEFNALEDQDVVKFVADQNDSICNSCAIGLHCKSRKGENIYLEAINKAAIDQGLEQSIQALEYSKATDELRSLEMPVWAAKQVLTGPCFPTRLKQTDSQRMGERRHLIVPSRLED